MVYNAMKLFMEINPQLFDDCSHDYNELQNSADKREEARKAKWSKLDEQASRMKSGVGQPPPRPKVDPDATQDSQQRLDALKLHDESTAVKQTSVSSTSCTFERQALAPPYTKNCLSPLVSLRPCSNHACP
jgi:serine/threonine-protein phosphatase 2A regulatory subunit B'